jgi:hypothetical protein
MVPSRRNIRPSIAVVAGMLATAWMLGGCAEMTGPSSAAPAGGQSAAKSSGLKMPSLSGGSYATTFTILCMEAAGTDGARMVDLMARGLRNVQGIDPSRVQTVSRNNTTRLYYGAYRGQVKKESDQFVPPDTARQDLAAIRSMASGQSQPFQLARIVEAPTPDPGPAEWNIKNAPGTYTLQITYVFDKPSLPNHKDVAVEICKTLREQGEEAWYLLEDRISVVTVGHFDESAVEKDPEGKPIGYGPAVQALQNKREEFKYNTECFQKVVHVIGNQRIAAPSILIEIPREKKNEPAAQQAPQRPDPFGHR